MNSTSTTNKGPRNPTAGEYPALLKFLSHSYGFADPRWFEKDAPHFFGKNPDQLKTKWILKVGGKIVSHVGIFPFTALVEGRKLKVAGIGAVATHPDFRGQGLMKSLMEKIDEEIIRGGYDLSILWGERGLYLPYGYERALFMDQFSFQKKPLEYFAAPEKVRPARDKDLPAIQKLYSNHPSRLLRKTDQTSSAFKRFERKNEKPLWVLEEKGKVAAYALFWRPASFWKPAPGPLDLAEWGGGAEDVACLIATVLQNESTDYLTATVYPGCGLHLWALENCSNQARVTQSFMVKPLNLLGVLKAFEPQIQQRAKALGLKGQGSLTIQMEEGQDVTLVFGSVLRVAAGKGKGPLVILTQTECSRLLWGAGRPSDFLGDKAKGAELLDVLFPLDWYWWRSDWI